MDRQELFDRRVRELEAIVAKEPWDELELLNASGIVRALLLDQHPLYTQVDRPRRRRLMFHVRERMSVDAKPSLWFAGVGISPRLALHPGQDLGVNLDQFLKRPVMTVDDKTFSVREAVLYLAHFEGGVHAGHPQTDDDLALQAVNAGWSLGGVSAVASTMRGIADVVVSALKPLTRQ